MAAADLSRHTDKQPMTIRKVFYHFYLLKSEKEIIPEVSFRILIFQQ